MTETTRPVVLTKAEIEDCLSAVRASICDYYYQSCEASYEEEEYLDNLIATLNGIEWQLDLAFAHIHIKEVDSSSITLDQEKANLLCCSLSNYYDDETDVEKKLKAAFAKKYFVKVRANESVEAAIDQEIIATFEITAMSENAAIFRAVLMMYHIMDVCVDSKNLSPALTIGKDPTIIEIKEASAQPKTFPEICA